jgi:hypothetical protein
MALRQVQGRLSRQPAKPALSAVEGMPALDVRNLLAIGVVVGFAGASQRDLVMRELPTLRDWRSLRVRIGLRFGARMRGFPDVDRLNAVNWSDHSLVLRDRIGRVREIFSSFSDDAR